uniref:NAD kinase n=1 Tax=Roseihalotalea indica TaxID=2867963 RepID=A0AA49GUA0_9BACT|nr:NAD kinase [Tunicatimonas sp. TK19036]
MRFAIHGRKVDEGTLPCIQHLLSALTQRRAQIKISDILHTLLKESSSEIIPESIYLADEGVSDVDFVISIGGDGTLLETVTHVRAQEIPILGINIGRLGFLATVSQHQITNAIEALFQGRYSYDLRTLVKTQLLQDIPSHLNFALNELTVIKKDSSSMIVAHAYLDDRFLNSYWADGLIISTPTGSTGYSLSCGGPVVSPQSNNLIITPISPHNLTVRPLVVSDSSRITIQVESRSDSYLLALDSRSYAISTEESFQIEKTSFQVKLVKFIGDDFLETLRQKLNWGLDVRN